MRRHAARRDLGVELRDADERGRERAEGQRQRDSLRHRGHRHPHAHRVADDDADHQSGDDPPVVDDRVVEQRAGDGEQHAERRHLHSAPCPVGARETAQSQNEQDRRNEVADLNESVAHVREAGRGKRDAETA